MPNCCVQKIVCVGQSSTWALTPAWCRPPGPPVSAGLWLTVWGEPPGDAAAEGTPRTQLLRPAWQNGPSSAKEEHRGTSSLDSCTSVTVCVCGYSYRHHPVLPVVFVVRQHFSDLGQLVLHLSVRVDLNTKRNQQDAPGNDYVWKLFISQNKAEITDFDLFVWETYSLCREMNASQQTEKKDRWPLKFQHLYYLASI